MSERMNLNEKYDDIMEMFKHNPEAQSFIIRLMKDTEKKDAELKKMDRFFRLSVCALCIMPFTLFFFKFSTTTIMYALSIASFIVMCIYVRSVFCYNRIISVFSEYTLSELKMFNEALKNNSVHIVHVPILRAGKSFFVKTGEREYQNVTKYVSNENQKTIAEKCYFFLESTRRDSIDFPFENIYLEEKHEFMTL